MNDHTRPLLLGYVRANVLQRSTDLARAEAELEAFAQREEYSLGTIYVARDGAPGAFHALMDEMSCDETASGVVVPDLRHVTPEDYMLMRRHQQGCARGAIFVANFSPCSGGPDGVSPVRRQVCRSTPG